MRRPACLLLAAAALAGAEVARRDLQLAVEAADPAFSYRIDSPVGSFSGDDAFDRDLLVRPGVRWALARPGSAWAALLGADATIEDAALPGGGLRAYGGALSAGATWALAERWAVDGEAWAGRAKARLDLTTAEGGSLSGSGDRDGYGLRLRTWWQPARRWSLGLELGWARRSVTIDADLGRQVELDQSGFSLGLVAAWRPSARPAGLE